MFILIQKLIRVLIIASTALTAIFFSCLIFFGFGIHFENSTHEPRLAFWMEHDWAVRGEKSDADWITLKERVESLPISDLYFHVGPLDENGNLPENVDIDIERFNEIGGRHYAWMGQLRAKIELENPLVRRAFIDNALLMIENGFDGIHLNIEPVRRNDEAYLLLVNEMKEALGEKPLSLAMDQWQPHLLTRAFSLLFGAELSSYYTSSQVKTLSQAADQMIVMTYDTDLKQAALYSWWVEQQMIALSKRLDEGTELFIGIPSYEEGLSLHPNAENIKSGINGYMKGIKNIRTKKETVSGLAVYSYWEMDDNEWETLKTFYATALRK